MTGIVINVDLTVDMPGLKKTMKLHSVKNSMGDNIMNVFVDFAKDNNLPLDSQHEIEKAIEEFVKKYENDAFVLP